MSGRLGSLLDAHECCVDFEHVRKVLGAHRSEVVAANTENNGKLALMGADAKCASTCMMHVSTQGETHFTDRSVELILSASEIAITPDMSSPPFVRLFCARLWQSDKLSALMS